MSKPQLVVLGFLRRQPMYGYQIGQIVEEMKLPVWAGIKLPSIYKALQSLESSKLIRGEQEVEGNNPPRTVFHLNPSGVEQLRAMILSYLMDDTQAPQEWWLVLSFSWASITRDELISAVSRRLEKLEKLTQKDAEEHCRKMLTQGQLPFVIKHIMNLGIRHHDVEKQTLTELLEDIKTTDPSVFHKIKGEQT